VPRATYTAIILIGVVFAFVTFAMVTALGSTTVIDETVARSTVDDIPLLDPAAVLFSIADQYVGACDGLAAKQCGAYDDDDCVQHDGGALEHFGQHDGGALEHGSRSGA
jgi:hypothetical protein